MKNALRVCYQTLPIFLFVLLFSNSSFAQNNALNDITAADITVTGKRYTFPKEYRLLKLDARKMREALAAAPMEKAYAISDVSHGIIFSMPMPNGTTQHFKLVEYRVMHPDLAARYPNIKTYTGQGIDDPMATIKVDMTPRGFHAMVLSPAGNIFIDPYMENNFDYYICYNKSSLQQVLSFECGVTETKFEEANNATPLPKSSGTQLRTYRLALACTGEYAATQGGTTSGALAGMTTAMNRVNGVYEKEVAIRMVMVANNDQLIYLNANTDPYTNNNGGTMLGQNITTCNNVIGSANYDIGHVFSTGGGGVAYLGVPCGSSKAGGVTGLSNPVGDAFYIDYVAHEMGHQFGANHTFNSTTGSCGGGNRAASAAYEPGSGITIMAYAGICLATNNLADHSIAYFTTKSFDEITTFSQTGNGNTCAVTTSTGNTAPVVTSVGLNKSIPISTPFQLTGAGTDADNDPITYSWEQFDLGPAGNWNVQSTTAPMFRPFEPTTSPSRTFPKMSDVVNNTTTIGELLPNQARTLNFRLTIRDNKAGGGGVMHPDTTLKINVVNNGGAFTVTAPNTAVTWTGNSTQTVTWNVNGTTNAPINTSHVKISLSTDGGYTYPTVLLASTPNDGSETITVPNISTTTARIKVEAIDNYFFDISNVNFTITASSGITAISTGNITPNGYCSGNQLSVSFTVTGTGNSGNQFIAMLSNASGSFASQTNIGVMSGTGSGNIIATIPANTPAGTGYRIRVVSTNPAVTGSDNGNNITIMNAPVASNISPNGNTTFCAGGSVTLLGNNGGTWNTGSTAPSITVSTAGTYYVTNSNSCGSVQSNAITVTVNPLPVASTISANGNTTFCAGGSVTLLGNNGGTWNTGSTAPSITVSTAGTYYVTNSNSCGSVQSNAITVNVGGLIAVNAGTYGPFTLASPAITLIGSPAGGAFSGNGVNGNTFTPASAGEGDHTIQYAYTDGYGCTQIATTIITVTKGACNFDEGILSGPRSVCFSMDPNGPNAVYTVNPVNPGSITWYVPANAILVSGQGTTSAEIKFLTNYTNGYVTAKIENPCTGAIVTLKTNARAIKPAQPGSISGSANSCLYIGTGLTGFYTVKKVPFADAYIWRVPAGVQIVSHPNGPGENDTIIEVSFNNNFVRGTTMGVRSVSYCGTSNERTFTISGTDAAVPGAISGPTESCPYIDSGNPAIYTIRKVASATSFNWTVPAGATIVYRPEIGTPNDTIIHVNYTGAFTGGKITVSATNGCSTSGTRSITIKKSIPIIPSKIYGDPNAPTGPRTIAPVDACPYIFTQTPAVYSIAKDRYGFTTGYEWTLSDNVNAYILSHPGGYGVNDTIIEVMFDVGFTTATLTVKGTNGCGVSPQRSIIITKKVPGTPTPIAGDASPCPSTIQSYSTTGENADWFEWTLLPTMTLISGQGTNTITVSLNSDYRGGTLKVQTTSACGSSSVRSLRLTKCSALPQRPEFTVKEQGNTKESLTLFPNPSMGDFYIYLPVETTYSKAGITVMDLTGREIYHTQIQLIQGKAGLNLQSKLLPGTYFVQVVTEKQKYTARLIIK